MMWWEWAPTVFHIKLNPIPAFDQSLSKHVNWFGTKIFIPPLTRLIILSLSLSSQQKDFDKSFEGFDYAFILVNLLGQTMTLHHRFVSWDSEVLNGLNHLSEGFVVYTCGLLSREIYWILSDLSQTTLYSMLFSPQYVLNNQMWARCMLCLTEVPWGAFTIMPSLTSLSRSALISCSK